VLTLRGLEAVEESIDDCLSLAKSIDFGGLSGKGHSLPHPAAAFWLGTSPCPLAWAAWSRDPPGQQAWPWPGPSAWTAGRSSKSPRHGQRAEGS
jgi:hypothetical protein